MIVKVTPLKYTIDNLAEVLAALNFEKPKELLKKMEDTDLELGELTYNIDKNVGISLHECDYECYYSIMTHLTGKNATEAYIERDPNHNLTITDADVEDLQEIIDAFEDA